MPAVLRHFEALFHEPLSSAEVACLGVPMLCLSGAQSVATTQRVPALLRAALPVAQHEVLPAMGTWARCCQSSTECLLDACADFHSRPI